MPAVDWRWYPEAGEDAGAPRVGLSRLELVAKSCSFSNKNGETLSYNVAAFRFVEIGVSRLVMPTHVVISYTKDNGTPSPAQVNRLVDFIDTEIERHPLMSKIEGHYRSLSCLLRHKTRITPCRVFQWAVSLHFRENNILSDGQFMGFGCGMRGKLSLGTFDVQSEECLSDFRRRLAEPTIDRAFLNVSESLHDCQRHCFVDWVGFDMILSKQIGLDTAGEWFVFFKDPAVRRFIEYYEAPIAST